MTHEAVILSAVRSPIGSFGGGSTAVDHPGGAGADPVAQRAGFVGLGGGAGGGLGERQEDTEDHCSG